MNQRNVLLSAVFVLASVAGLRQYHKIEVAGDKDKHYRLGIDDGKHPVHDVAVGKQDHHVHGTKLDQSGIIKTIEGDEREILTAESFRALPNQIAKLKSNFAELEKRFEEDSSRKNFPQQDYMRTPLNKLQELIDGYVKKSDIANYRHSTPHLERKMIGDPLSYDRLTSGDYPNQFKALFGELTRLEDELSILIERPKQVELDTGLSQGEIKKIVGQCTNPKPPLTVSSALTL